MMLDLETHMYMYTYAIQTIYYSKKSEGRREKRVRFSFKIIIITIIIMNIIIDHAQIYNYMYNIYILHCMPKKSL